MNLIYNYPKHSAFPFLPYQPSYSTPSDPQVVFTRMFWVRTLLFLVKMLTGFSRHVNTIAQKKSLNYILLQKTSLVLSFSFIEHSEIIRKHLICTLISTNECNDIILNFYANCDLLILIKYLIQRVALMLKDT